MNFNGMYQPMGMPGYPMPQQINGYAQPEPMRQIYPASRQNFYPISPETDRIWVRGEDEVERYFVASGHSADFWDMDKNVIYVKIADQTGKTKTQILDYTIRNIDVPQQAAGGSMPPEQRYVTWDEFSQFTARFEQMMKPVSGGEENGNAE